MALDDLLARLKGGESVTPRLWAGVTRKPAPTLAVTLVTPVTPEKTAPEVCAAEPALPITRLYFIGLGIDVLPEDIAHLRWFLPRGIPEHNAAVREYVERWQAAMDAEPADQKKQNRGRFAANDWLRTMHAKPDGVCE